MNEQKPWSRSKAGTKLALLAMIAAPMFVAVIAFVVLRTVQMDGDSPCYLEWCPKRTAIYPVFIDLIDPALLLPIQLALLAAAIAWLTYYSFSLFGNVLLTGALALGLVANPYVWQLQSSVMSEALTTPLLMVLLGLTLGYLATRCPKNMLAAALVAGVIGATRPGILPVVAIPLAAIWLTTGNAREKALRTFLCLALWLSPILAERIYSHSVLGARSTSLAGRHMFAKAGLVEAPSLDRSRLGTVEKRLADVLEREVEPMRQTLRPLQGNVRDIVRLNYEVCLQYACGERLTKGLRLPRQELDRALLRVGLARLAQNPAGYLALAWDNYRGLWLLHPRKHPGLAPEYNEYLASAAPLPFQQFLGEEAQLTPPDEQKMLYRYDRALLLAIGLGAPFLMIAAAVALVRDKGNPLLAGSLACLLGLQAVLIFTAMFGVGIPRYVMGIWPVVVAGFIFALYYFAEMFGRSFPNARALGVWRRWN